MVGLRFITWNVTKENEPLVPPKPSVPLCTTSTYLAHAKLTSSPVGFSCLYMCVGRAQTTYMGQKSLSKMSALLFQPSVTNSSFVRDGGHMSPSVHEYRKCEVHVMSRREYIHALLSYSGSYILFAFSSVSWTLIKGLCSCLF